MNIKNFLNPIHGFKNSKTSSKPTIALVVLVSAGVIRATHSNLKPAEIVKGYSLCRQVDSDKDASLDYLTYIIRNKDSC